MHLGIKLKTATTLYLRHLETKLNWKIKNWKVRTNFYWFVLEEISEVTNTRYKAKKRRLNLMFG